MFESPCPYASLANYDWKDGRTPDVPETCPGLIWNPFVYSLVAGFQGCTLCIATYLHFQLFYTFKGKKTLYFWAILATLWGTLIELIRIVITQTRVDDMTTTVLMNIAWVPMVTGFSLVLYSRLHLLNPDPRLLRVVLAFIVFNAIVFHTPLILITTLAMAKVLPVTPRTLQIYTVFSLLGIMFSVQRFLIATLYIYLFVRFTKESTADKSVRLALRLLVASELLVVSTDALMYGLLYYKFFMVRTMLQTWLSVLKLQIEFLILNWLLKFSKRHVNRMELGTWQGEHGSMNAPDVVTTPWDVDSIEATVHVAAAGGKT